MKDIFKVLLNFFEITIICTGAILLSYVFVGQLLEVSGDSMYPTIKDREQLVAEKLTIRYKQPEPGEIVIVEHPDEKGVLLVKRVIAVPNDRIMIRDGYVFINDKVISEPYLVSNTKTEANTALREGVEYELDKSSYVLLGDNRAKSTDSRYWGIVSEESIIGRALVVYYPIANFRFIN